MRLGPAVICIFAITLGLSAAIQDLQPARAWALGTLSLGILFSARRGLFKPLDLTEPIHWGNLVFVLLFALHPLAVLNSQTGGVTYQDRFSIGGTYPDAVFLGFAATAAFNFAYGIVASQRRLDRRTHRLRAKAADPEVARTLDAPTLRNWAWIYLIVGSLATIYALLTGAHTNSGAGDYGAGRTAYIYFLPMLVTGSSLIWALVWMRTRSKSDRLKFFLVTLANCGLLFYGGQRSSLLLAVMIPALYVVIRSGLRINRAIVLVTTVAGLLALALVRDANAPGETFWSSVSSSFADASSIYERTFTGADTEMVDALALELQFVPSRLDHQPGIMLISTAAAPIPRLLWADKPAPADVALNSFLFNRGVNQAGVAYSILGEAYFDSGPTGIVIVSLLLGATFAQLYTRVRVPPSNGPVGPVVFAISVACLPLLLRGILAYSLGIYGFLLAPVLLAVYLSYRKNRSGPLVSQMYGQHYSVQHARGQ